MLLVKRKAKIKEPTNVSIPVQQDLERRNEELEELYLLEGCFPEAEKLKRDTKLLSQVRLIFCVCATRGNYILIAFLIPPNFEFVCKTSLI